MKNKTQSRIGCACRQKKKKKQQILSSHLSQDEDTDKNTHECCFEICSVQRCVTFFRPEHSRSANNARLSGDRPGALSCDNPPDLCHTSGRSYQFVSGQGERERTFDEFASSVILSQSKTIGAVCVLTCTIISFDFQPFIKKLVTVTEMLTNHKKHYMGNA